MNPATRGAVVLIAASITGALLTGCASESEPVEPTPTDSAAPTPTASAVPAPQTAEEAVEGGYAAAVDFFRAWDDILIDGGEDAAPIREVAESDAAEAVEVELESLRQSGIVAQEGYSAFEIIEDESSATPARNADGPAVFDVANVFGCLDYSDIVFRRDSGEEQSAIAAQKVEVVARYDADEQRWYVFQYRQYSAESDQCAA